MGCTALLYLMAHDYATFQEHVSVFVALAPAAKITTSSSPVVRWMASEITEVQDLFEYFNMYELLPSNVIFYYMLYFFCGFIPETCYLMMVLLSDKQLRLFDADQF